jgi:hypothetical protein
VVYTRRASKGLSFLASYAFQKTLTNTDSANMYYGGSAQDVYNRGLEKSVASFDHTQVLKLTWTYELPLGRGQRFFNRGGVTNQVLGGWHVSANQSYQTGDALSISSDISQNANYLFNSTVRPDVVLGQPLRIAETGSLDVAGGGAGITYINPKAFVDPPQTANGVVTRAGHGATLLRESAWPVPAIGKLQRIQTFRPPWRGQGQVPGVPRRRLQRLQPGGIG